MLELKDFKNGKFLCTEINNKQILNVVGGHSEVKGVETEGGVGILGKYKSDEIVYDKDGSIDYIQQNF